MLFIASAGYWDVRSGVKPGTVADGIRESLGSSMRKFGQLGFMDLPSKAG
jgi:hypothetical protein